MKTDEEIKKLYRLRSTEFDDMRQGISSVLMPRNNDRGRNMRDIIRSVVVVKEDSSYNQVQKLLDNEDNRKTSYYNNKINNIEKIFNKIDHVQLLNNALINGQEVGDHSSFPQDPIYNACKDEYLKNSLINDLLMLNSGKDYNQTEEKTRIKKYIKTLNSEKDPQPEPLTDQQRILMAIYDINLELNKLKDNKLEDNKDETKKIINNAFTKYMIDNTYNDADEKKQKNIENHILACLKDTTKDNYNKLNNILFPNTVNGRLTEERFTIDLNDETQNIQTQKNQKKETILKKLNTSLKNFFNKIRNALYSKEIKDIETKCNRVLTSMNQAQLDRTKSQRKK